MFLERGDLGDDGGDTAPGQGRKRRDVPAVFVAAREKEQEILRRFDAQPGQRALPNLAHALDEPHRKRNIRAFRGERH